MKTVFVGMGSNINDPARQVSIALDKFHHLPAVQCIKCSSLYLSSPLGSQHQPDFVNAVVELKTELAAETLLQQLFQLENQQNRVREQRWGPRTLDLDLLLYGDEIIATPTLTVPHPGLKVREFVLYPLAEIRPTLVLPTGEKIRDLLAQCTKIAVKLEYANHRYLSGYL